MELHNLKPAKGSTHKRRSSAVVKAPDMAEPLHADIKEHRLVPAIPARSGLKEVKCQSKGVFLSLDSRISTGLNIWV